MKGQKSDMAMQFTKATKSQAKLRAAFFGPSGAGKTMSALRVGTGLADGKPLALIDTERGSASKYADRFNFDVLELGSRTIDSYVEAINAAAAAGFPVLIIDSLTHAWQQLLTEIDALAKAKYRGNTWSAWSEGTPKQRKLVDAILNYPGHVIATMRTKTEWLEEKDQNGKIRPVRVGLAPEQGKGIEYDFDLLLEITTEHYANVIKDRTGKFQDRMIEKPGEEFGHEMLEWLSDGAPAPAFVPPVVDTAVPKPAPAKKAAAAKVAKPTPTIGGEPESPAFPLQNNPTASPPPAIVVPKGAPEWWESLALLIQYNNIEWSDLDRVLGSTSVERADGLVRPNASQITAWLTERQANGETLDTALASLVGQAHSMKDVA